ncbi:spore germination protein [Clostridium aquiflavi]|uniref:Spore germination protein n=1 Tax=Clostridium aquiflavi TaxID=3073603 RepID=A0ABU1EIZ2_9CLOT|nr:spore germination protein [Clostridium sp. 5N-1]MDR5588375.1 spore germination protein [Clostridium sp. 5N-1]
MKITSGFDNNISLIKSKLKVKESFDIIQRNIIIGNKKTTMFYIDGFTKDDVMERIMNGFFTIKPEVMNSYKTPSEFIDNAIPYIEVSEEVDLDKIIDAVLCGQTSMFIDGYDKCIILDMRTYPVRGLAEPEKEKTLRGARDGFVETIVFNTALIRRRIRDSRLIFDMHTIGKISKTDVCIAYMDGIVDKRSLDIVLEKIKKINVDTLTLGDQSLVETLSNRNYLNPFPKVRYTERPDVASSHLTEGNIIILVDNSPTAMILPTSIFDFLQDVDDYYFPIFTGNYLRIIRNIITISTIVLTPLYLLFINGNITLPAEFNFLFPKDSYSIPIFWQFLILEVAIDGLKLASLNTPNSLGMSLSVIGGLILGEYTVTTGWFIPQSILYMSIVALASFEQSSIELGYALKFMRVLLLILSAILGYWGFIVGLLLIVFIMYSTKTITNDRYFYPLVPFNWSKLKNLLFRTRIK